MANPEGGEGAGRFAVCGCCVGDVRLMVCGSCAAGVRGGARCVAGVPAGTTTLKSEASFASTPYL